MASTTQEPLTVVKRSSTGFEAPDVSPSGAASGTNGEALHAAKCVPETVPSSLTTPLPSPGVDAQHVRRRPRLGAEAQVRPPHVDAEERRRGQRLAGA